MKLLYLLLSIFGLTGTVVSVIQFVMAVRYSEWGRVIVYFFLAVMCAEMLAAAAWKLYRSRKKPEDHGESE